MDSKFEASKEKEKKESILYKKASFNNAPESKVGIAPDYEVIDKHLVTKDGYQKHVPKVTPTTKEPKPSKASSPKKTNSLTPIKTQPTAKVTATASTQPIKSSSQRQESHKAKTSKQIPELNGKGSLSAGPYHVHYNQSHDVNQSHHLPSADVLQHLDEDEKLMYQEQSKSDLVVSAHAAKVKRKTNITIIGDYKANENAKLVEKEIDDDISVIENVIESKNQVAKSETPTPSWEKFLAEEMGMDHDLIQSHPLSTKAKNVHVDRAILEQVKLAHQGDKKRQFDFIEQVIASYIMKDLTSKYGSKGKSAKQYFMEAYDTDVRGAVLGDEEKEGSHRYDAHGKEIHHVHHHSEDKGVEQSESVFGSAIAIKSLDGINQDGNVNRMGYLMADRSNFSFWKSLEKIERGGDSTRSFLTGSLAPSVCPSSVSTVLSPVASSVDKEEEIKEPGDEHDSLGTDTNAVMDECLLDKFLEPTLQEVVQSDAVRRAWIRTKHQLELFNVKDPIAYDLFGKLYEEVRDYVRLPEDDIEEFEGGTWEPPIFHEMDIFKLEPQEKLFGRYRIYQKAMMYMIEHFEPLRPLLAEIKQSYEEVLEKCEKEWKDLKANRMDVLRRKDAYGRHVRKTDEEGDRSLMQARVQAHALQQHIQWQQHTLYSILGMLWKMRQSLKMQSRMVKKIKVIFKQRVETLAREIVSSQGQSMFEMTLPGKYTEIMERFKHVQDPKEIRRILNSARRQLRKAHKQIVVFEADYADTVPRTEFEIYNAKYITLLTKNKSVIQKSDELKAEIEIIKKRIAEKNTKMYEEVGLDELTGEKPIIYLETMGNKLSVPMYLRYDQPIVDLKYTSQEAASLIYEIWNKRSDLLEISRRIKKARDDEQEGIASYPDDLQYDMPAIPTFPDFVGEFFRQKCDLVESAMEYTYNLLAACRRHTSDPELSLFLGILEGNIDESVYHLFQIELARIKELAILKANESKDNKGYLGFGEFCKYLQEICPNKTDEEFVALSKTAQSISGARGDWAMVPVLTFFQKTDASGKENEFVTMLYNQFEADRKTYIREIHNEVLLELGISEKLLEQADDPAWLTDVSMHVFYAAITSVDPSITEEGIARFLVWVYLGMTALPGIITLGTRLVEFLKDRAHMAYYELEKFNEDEDMEFEDCIRQLKEYEEDDSTLDKLDMKKRRLQTKKLKYASLRQVTDRLYSGPFVRFGKRPVVDTMNTDYSMVPSAAEMDEEAEESLPPPTPEHHHHHHHHRHGHKHHHRHRKQSSGRESVSKDRGEEGSENTEM